jgi:cytidylate kinase
MTADREQAVVLITGIQAAGKSTVAQLLAERLTRSVHLRGDLYRRMIVSGRADITPELTGEAAAQLQLRYRLTAETADEILARAWTAARIR